MASQQKGKVPPKKHKAESGSGDEDELDLQSRSEEEVSPTGMYLRLGGHGGAEGGGQARFGSSLFLITTLLAPAAKDAAIAEYAQRQLVIFLMS